MCLPAHCHCCPFFTKMHTVKQWFSYSCSSSNSNSPQHFALLSVCDSSTHHWYSQYFVFQVLWLSLHKNPKEWKDSCCLLMTWTMVRSCASIPKLGNWPKETEHAKAGTNGSKLEMLSFIMSNGECSLTDLLNNVSQSLIPSLTRLLSENMGNILEDSSHTFGEWMEQQQSSLNPTCVRLYGAIMSGKHNSITL